MSQYPDSKKVEVVTTYLALGKVPMVEAVTGVNRHTIRQWKMQPWWAEMVEQIQTESDQELDAKLAKIVERSLDAVNDRIENGDFVFDPKTGSVKRSPVKLRDVHRVSVDLLDKRDLLRRKPKERIEESATLDILTKLAGEFAKWAKNNLKEKTVEGVVVDAVTEMVEPARQSGEVESVSKTSLPEESGPAKTAPSN